MAKRVLVGVVRNREQLKANLESCFYHIPAGNVSDEHLPVEFVALYLSQNSFGEGGVCYLGRVVSTRKLPRGKIPELPAKNPEQPYCRFDVEKWIKLSPPVQLGGRLMICAFTDMDSLFLGEAGLYAREPERDERAEERRGGFYMTREQQERVETTEMTVTASTLAGRINASLGKYHKQVDKADITSWLVENDLMNELEDPKGRTYRMPTRAGMGLGIVILDCVTEDGRYYKKIKYRIEMQRLIINHINAIMAR